MKAQISISIDQDILTILKVAADQESRSLSQYINYILKRHIETSKQTKPE